MPDWLIIKQNQAETITPDEHQAPSEEVARLRTTVACMDAAVGYPSLPTSLLSLHMGYHTHAYTTSTVQCRMANTRSKGYCPTWKSISWPHESKEEALPATRLPDCPESLALHRQSLACCSCWSAWPAFRTRWGCFLEYWTSPYLHLVMHYKVFSQTGVDTWISVVAWLSSVTWKVQLFTFSCYSSTSTGELESADHPCYGKG